MAPNYRDVARLAAVVVERRAHEFHALGDRLVVDDAAGPDLGHEIAAGDHVRRAAHQRQQQVERQSGKR
jgi:hypothetical protein